MRNGIELWVEKARVEEFQNLLARTTNNRFVSFGEETINTADVVGIFDAKRMEELTRRRNGQWQCKYGEWHEKKETCDCWRISDRNRRSKAWDEKIREFNN